MSSEYCNPFIGKIDPVAKKIWCEALRSGEFKQGKGHLKRNSHGVTRYCCLGVLCEIFPGLEGNGTKRMRATFLNDESLDLLGLERNDQDVLANYNDGEIVTGRNQKNFNEIADIVEKYL